MRTQVSALLQRLSQAMPLALPTPRTSIATHTAAHETNRIIPRRATTRTEVAPQKPAWDSSVPLKPEETRRYDIPLDIPAVVGKVVQVADDVLVIDSGDQRTTIRLQAIVMAEGNSHLRALTQNRLQSLIGCKVLAAGYQGTSGIDIVARVLDGEVDINCQLLLAGLARYDESDARTLNQRDRVLYAQAERQARAARQGMWRNSRR